MKNKLTSVRTFDTVLCNKPVYRKSYTKSTPGILFSTQFSSLFDNYLALSSISVPMCGINSLRHHISKRADPRNFIHTEGPILTTSLTRSGDKSLLCPVESLNPIGNPA